MNQIRKVLLSTLILFGAVGGISTFGQRKDDPPPPRKKGDVVVPVAPKRDPPKGNGNQNSNHDRKRP
jgi:hypothetical protein